MHIKNATQPIHLATQLATLKDIITKGAYSKVFVLGDNNTISLCLPVFRDMLAGYSDFDVIETDAGEENKTIDFCIGIWKTLLDFGADRKSLLINLGGGVVTDMGGFVASTYKRGIDFINIPTTLLSQVDASVGSKTGIDIDNIKNMVGTFSTPIAVFIEPIFLKTLAPRELLSGFAEMIKHGLIADDAYYYRLKKLSYTSIEINTIYESISIKNEVVTKDPNEKGLRKILNFGHTIGHAIESYALSNDKKPLTHGEAIAIGMICEAYLSTTQNTLTKNELADITDYINSIFPTYTLKEKKYDEYIALMMGDKKNENGKILFSLLPKIGKCDFNCSITTEDIIQSFNYYNQSIK